MKASKRVKARLFRPKRISVSHKRLRGGGMAAKNLTKRGESHRDADIEAKGEGGKDGKRMDCQGRAVF